MVREGGLFGACPPSATGVLNLSLRSRSIEHMFDTWEWKTAQDSREGLPEGLANMPPGHELGRLLEGIDRSQLNGHELVSLLQARARQVAHDQAEFYADMWELAF